MVLLGWKWSCLGSHTLCRKLLISQGVTSRLDCENRILIVQPTKHQTRKFKEVSGVSHFYNVQYFVHVENFAKCFLPRFPLLQDRGSIPHIIGNNVQTAPWTMSCNSKTVGFDLLKPREVREHSSESLLTNPHRHNFGTKSSMHGLHMAETGPNCRHQSTRVRILESCMEHFRDIHTMSQNVSISIRRSTLAFWCLQFFHRIF